MGMVVSKLDDLDLMVALSENAADKIVCRSIRAEMALRNRIVTGRRLNQRSARTLVEVGV